MSQKNLWPKKLQELNDVAPLWPEDVKPGDVLVVNANKDGFSFGSPGGQGEKGDPGDTGPVGPPNVLSIGSVTEGPAAASIEGTSPEQVLNLVIPKGDTGAAGEDGAPGVDAREPVFTIGSVTSGIVPDVALSGDYPNLVLDFQLVPGADGTDGADGPPNSLSIGTVEVDFVPSATITGSAPNQVLNLVMPIGPKGETGDTGPAGPPTPLPATVEVTASRNFADTDENKYLRSTSATAVSLTMPLDLVVSDANAEIHVRQAGAGAVTLVAASGVTLNVPFSGTLVLAGQGATVTLKRVGANEWDVFGLVAAA